MKYKNIAIIAAKNNPEAIRKKDLLIARYGFKDLTSDHKNSNADLIIAIGGDGLILRLLHDHESKPIPIYGMNSGTVGFLLNSFIEEDLLEIINNANEAIIHPLRMYATDYEGNKYSYIAINEVSLLRQSSQAAHIKIKINDEVRLGCLTADGIMVATSAGSTAYNLSAGGPIIPFGARILALTPISPFRPRNWRGAILAENSRVGFEVIDEKNRPVSAMADAVEVKNVKEVMIMNDDTISFKILFDPKHSLEERIVREQFYS